MYYIIAEDGNCACDIKPRLQEPCGPEQKIIQTANFN